MNWHSSFSCKIPSFDHFALSVKAVNFPGTTRQFSGLRDQSLEGGSDIRLHLEGAASGNQKVVPLEESED